MSANAEQTPLMKQYWEMKSAHQDKVLLFRMGDFFEMFHDDAVTAAPVLGVALTARNKKSADQTPMCGVPHHSIGGHINKLLSHGFKVAICDQVEDAKLAKGLVKRAVTRILSPGMVFDPETLDGHAFNYLCAVDVKSVSFVEPTTGESFFYKVSDLKEQQKLISIIHPVEFVCSSPQLEALKARFGDGYVYSVHDDVVDTVTLDATVTGTAPDELNANKATPITPTESARRLIAYAVHMQGADILKTLTPFESREFESRLQVDADVLRHLEIFKTYKGEARGSLFDAINCTLTAGGSRRLRQWMCFPHRQEAKIQNRQDGIAFWLKHNENLRTVRRSLKGVGDLERKMGKIAHPQAHPRDLKNLADTFSYILEVFEFFPDRKKQRDKILLWREELDRLLEDELPVQFREGGIIRRGVSPELDELIELSTNSQGKILELEAKERELTQISGLKIRYNNVFGFYIEITHTHTAKVPLSRYQRKQTLTNAERYTTDELMELERKVVSARTRRAELELEIYQQLKRDVLAEMRTFLEVAQFLSDLDATTSLAWLALENNYCRPVFSADGHLKLEASRHAVVERTVSFVPNDIELAGGECLLLTGPNMAGKSTIMRQVAITALLAQMGSYVPARQALLPLYDRIFTRIGASDFLTEGLSTFMVEMKETATMLKESTAQSLVILDEVGRGTSTYDGLSLAQSILEHLITERHSMVFFATHYHELTELDHVFTPLKNAHMSIHDKNAELKFLYTLAKGPAMRSYGIQVARLAGLPAAVTRRAEGLLRQLERATGSRLPALSQLDLWSQEPVENAMTAVDSPALSVVSSAASALAQASPSLASAVAPPSADSIATDPRCEAILEELKDFSIQTMTPLEALNKIAQWQKDLR